MRSWKRSRAKKKTDKLNRSLNKDTGEAAAVNCSSVSLSALMKTQCSAVHWAKKSICLRGPTNTTGTGDQ